MHAMQVRRHNRAGQEDESEAKRTEMGNNRSRCDTSRRQKSLRTTRRGVEFIEYLDVKNEDKENTVCTLLGWGKPEKTAA